MLLRQFVRCLKRAFFMHIIGRVKTRTGKWTRWKGTVRAFGETARARMPVHEDGCVDCTLEELASMAIRCAWCGQAIFIGEPITLYGAKDGFTPPEGSARYEEDPRAFVGCLGWNCAETGADRAGFWVPDPKHPGKGRVHRVPSPLEMLMMNPEAGMLIIADLSDAQAAEAGQDG